MSEIMEMSKLSQTNNFLLCLATIKHVLAAGEPGGGIPRSGGSGQLPYVIWINKQIEIWNIRNKVFNYTCTRVDVVVDSLSLDLRNGKCSNGSLKIQISIDNTHTNPAWFLSSQNFNPSLPLPPPNTKPLSPPSFQNSKSLFRLFFILRRYGPCHSNFNIPILFFFIDY